jgi:hypothetical protein
MSSRDFLFDVDLLVVAGRLGFDVVEVPTVWIDQAGSKLSAAADASRMLKSTLRLWIHHRTMPVVPASGVPVRGARTVLEAALVDAGSPEQLDVHAARARRTRC